MENPTRPCTICGGEGVFAVTARCLTLPDTWGEVFLCARDFEKGAWGARFPWLAGIGEGYAASVRAADRVGLGPR